jgi:hypothetical protein
VEVPDELIFSLSSTFPLRFTTMKPSTTTTTLDYLPRSIRWRLQLGLISKPTTPNWTMHDLLFSDENMDMITTQRNSSQLLLTKHDHDLQQALHPPDVWIDQTLDPLSQLVQLHQAENAKCQELAFREIQRRSSMSNGREEALPLSVSTTTYHLRVLIVLSCCIRVAMMLCTRQCPITSAANNTR